MEWKTGRSSGWDNGTVEAFLGDNVNFDGGVTAGVVDLAGMNFSNRHDGWSMIVLNDSLGWT